MTDAPAKTYQDGLHEAAEVCLAAKRQLLGTGKRTNQYDRHTAEILANMAQRILDLGEAE